MSPRSIGELRAGYFLSDLLLGADRLSYEDRRSYQRFFRAVVEQRGFPLHTASFWNALFFGWDLDENGYLGRGMRLDLAESGAPIPVGAMTEVKAGQRILLAEVVYKEGREPGVDLALGFADPAVSGTKVRIARSIAATSVREALVLDFDAFGEGINDDVEAHWDRAARKGWLTKNRHLVVEATYGRGDADELLLFAHHVMEQYGDTLFADVLLGDGADLTRDEHWQLLVSSLQAVEELAVTTPGLATFGQYHYDRAAYERRLASYDGLFERDGLMTVARCLTTPTDKRSYMATGPLVREYLERGDGLQPEEQELLEGPSYARLVIEANATAAGLVGDTGMVEGAYVRLDDEYQGGGVWRAVRLNGEDPPEAAWHPLVALGLGYAESAPSVSALVPPNEEAEPPVVEASDKGWRVALRLCDLDRRELPVPPPAMAMLADNADDVLIDLNDGLGEAYPRKPRKLDRERGIVTNVLMPKSLFPGVYIRCTIGFGGRTISMRATPLAAPVEIGDRLLRLEFHEPTFRRDALHERLEVRAVQKARTLVDQIAAIFRARGRSLPDGGYALTTIEIAAAILGPSFSPDSARPIQLALEGGDYEYVDGSWIWRPTVGRRTSPRERQRVAALRASAGGFRLAAHLMPRRVPMHLSRKNPRPEKVETYVRARLENHANHLPEQLPPGRTWVRPFTIG